MAPPIALSADTTHADVLAGGSAAFVLHAKNTGAIQKTVSLGGVATNPVGWLYNFTPQILTIDGGATNNTTLVVSVSPNASVGSNVTLGFQASEATSPIDPTPQAVSDIISFTFTILPPPPAPAKPQPKITLDVDPTSATVGSRADGTITITDADSIPYDVTLSIAGPFGWHPTLELSAVKAYPGVSRFHVYASVPLDATNGTVQAFTIRARVGESDLTKTWSVTALAPPAATTATGGSPSGAGSPSSSTTSGAGAPSTGVPSSTPASSDPTFALTATALPARLDAPAGEAITGTIRLQNTGNSPLHLKLVPRAGDGWPVRLSANEFDLGAGTIRDIKIEMDVPRDAVPGGTGLADVSITGDAGLLKHATFTLLTVAGKPRDDSTTAAVVAPAAPVGGLGISPVVGTVAVGFAAVGAGALALARRPLREKAVWAGVGLYTRLLRPDVLGHEEREKLYRLVETRPGIHFHALQRELNWNTGTLTYHLRVLERHGFIVDRRDGPLRRFYISGAAPRKELFSQDAPHGLRADVLEAIRTQNGISQSDLALALSANKQTVNYHVKALERAGVIRVEKRGRETFLHMGGSAPAGPPATDEARA